MKGFELVKREDHWALYNEDGHKIAATVDGCNSKLSIKNCEEIERGYDLDELIAKKVNDFNIVDKAVEFSNANSKNNGAYIAYIAGAYEMAKALEILGDKKFSEDDMMKFGDWLWRAEYKNVEVYFNNTTKELFEIWKSLQQTEFDVEIVMDKDCYSSAGRCDKLIMADCIICTPVTYLRDENGCLILKRV